MLHTGLLGLPVVKTIQERTFADEKKGSNIFAEDSFDWEDFIIEAFDLEDTLDEVTDEDIHPLFSSTKVGEDSLEVGQKQVEGNPDELLLNILEDELLYYLHNR